MKVVLLAGGLGTRLSEETVLKPKPMVEIGGMPILWHIMKTYSTYGFNDFIICCGYKGYVIKEYFANYFLHKSDVTISLTDNSLKVHDSHAEPWTITLIDTGINSMTGGRIKRIQQYIGNEPFMFTYGDGVCDININDLVDFHKQKGRLCTVTSVQPSGKFGSLAIGEDQSVHSFLEKPKGDGSWINGGYFVCQPEVFDYIKDGDSTIFEQQPMETLAKDDEMVAFLHRGFWKPMDTARDKVELDEMWGKGKAPWKVGKMYNELENIYKGKRVFLTGHTGFKGSWMLKLLTMLGAEVKGYALSPNTDNDLFHLDQWITNLRFDYRRLKK